jgi:hypothetical protein
MGQQLLLLLQLTNLPLPLMDPLLLPAPTDLPVPHR